MLDALYRNVFDNPILTRELRRRMRGKALVYGMIGYIVLMTVTSIVILLASINPFGAESTQEMLAQLSDTGQTLFRSITVIQALLVLIIAPTITAGMTTGEKERKTFDFLRVTTITPWMYIVGCFLSTVFYVSLALLCALPLISLAFLYGGIGREDVLTAVLILLGASMILSAFGLYVSSIRDRTRTAQGVVVFMIFVLVFGGMSLLGAVTRWLGTNAGGVTLGARVGLFGMGIPLWILLAFGVAALATIFLLVATRKLFEPEETRAFSHWQFAVVLVAAGAASVGMASQGAVSNLGALAFLGGGCLLLATAAVTFSVGRMEVGDEIWHLKRLIPVLRPFDQTVPFLVAVGAGWWFVSGVFAGRAGAGATFAPGMIGATVVLSLCAYAFFCTFGRWATAVAVGRKGAGRLALAAVLVAWVGAPVLAGLLSMAGEPEGFLARVGAIAGRFSPAFVMAEAIDSPRLYPAGELGPVVPQMVAYGVLAVVFLAVGEFLRFRRWRGFNYHYDMPAA